MRDLTYRMSRTTATAYDRVTGDGTHAAVGDPETPTLLGAETIGAQRLDEWPSFVREAFGHLYRPDDAEAAPLPTPPTWAAQATRALLADPSMPELRVMCGGSRTLAADAAARLAYGVAGAVGLDELPKDKAAAREEGEARADVEALAELAEAATDEQRDAMVKAAKEAGKLWARAKARRTLVAGAAADPAAALAVGNVAARVAADTKAKAEAMAALRGLGFGREGRDGDLDGDVPVELAEQVMRDKLLRDVLAALGRIRQTARGKIDEVPGAGNLDVVGIDHGDDIGALVDDELALLVGGAEDDVLERLSEKRTMVWKRRREDKAGEGDFTVVLDCSGSMSMWSRATTSRALALALILDAVRARRRVVFVTFATTVLDVVVVERDGTGLSAAIRAAGRAPSGGTNADVALRRASKERSPGDKRADAAIITDGDWTADAHIAAELVASGGDFTEVRIADAGDHVTAGAVLADHPWMSAALVVHDVAGAVKAIGQIKRWKA